mgnify:CR=1 FL=1
MMSLEKLNYWADSYIKFQEKQEVPPSSSEKWWPVWKFYDLNDDNPEICWQVILLIISKTTDENVLGILGAGPLEDLIHSHGPAFVDRIEDEAKNNERFKSVLGNVWESSTEQVWGRIQKILAA